MAKATIIDTKPFAKVILDIKPKASKARNVDYPKKVQATNILPFKLRITNITISGIDPLSPPGIGVQIIGFSNYIL
jgi:hypothetical protein